MHELGTHCAIPVWGLSARCREEMSVQPDCTKPARQSQFSLKPQPASDSLKPTAKGVFLVFQVGCKHDHLKVMISHMITVTL